MDRPSERTVGELMQQRPDQPTILMGLAQFLSQDVRPAIEDKGLSFRVLIASAVAMSMALEQSGMDQREIDEMQSLGRLLDGLVPTADLTPKCRRETLGHMNEEIARMLKEDDIAPQQLDDLRGLLKVTLASQIAAMNPRFDLSDTLEKTA